MSSTLTATNQNITAKTILASLANQSLAANIVPSHKTTILEQTAEKTFRTNLETRKENVTDNKYSKVLIICGPTATGKTKFGIEVAKKFNGEIISADSRQVFTGKNLIHGKDLPPNIQYSTSNIQWRGRKLKYYEIDGVKIWLYDVVNPGEDFSIAYWKECADLVITDILSRNKLPVVVGGTGLYLKSLTQSLNQITIPPNPLLRIKLQHKSPKYLFNYLNRIDSFKAATLNSSDRSNPRRLIRAIEISQFKSPSPEIRRGARGEVLQIGLTSSREKLYQLVNQRIADRIAASAASEDPDLAGNPAIWQGIEHAIVRHQLTWFKKQPNINWFDVTRPSWQEKCIMKIASWVKQ